MHGFAAGVLLAMAQLCIAVESDGPLRIGGDKQLFLGPVVHCLPVACLPARIGGKQ